MPHLSPGDSFTVEGLATKSYACWSHLTTQKPTIPYVFWYKLLLAADKYTLKRQLLLTGWAHSCYGNWLTYCIRLSTGISTWTVEEHLWLFVGQQYRVSRKIQYIRQTRIVYDFTKLLKFSKRFPESPLISSPDSFCCLNCYYPAQRVIIIALGRLCKCGLFQIQVYLQENLEVAILAQMSGVN